MNTVGIKEHKDKIGINKMYDLYGREILRPNGFYIRNNKLFYE